MHKYARWVVDAVSVSASMRKRFSFRSGLCFHEFQDVVVPDHFRFFEIRIGHFEIILVHGFGYSCRKHLFFVTKNLRVVSILFSY